MLDHSSGLGDHVRQESEEAAVDIAKLDPLGGHPCGQRGRPSKLDYPQLTNMALYMVRDASLSTTDAAWIVVAPQMERNHALPFHNSTVARLRRKFGQNPWIFRSVKHSYERKVQHIVSRFKKQTVSLRLVGLITQRQFNILTFSELLLYAQAYDDPRVIKAAEELWKKIRPSRVLLAAMGYSSFAPDSALAGFAEGNTRRCGHIG